MGNTLVPRSIFPPAQPEEPGFFRRIFGGEPPRNAFVALNNLLATSTSIRDVTEESLQPIIRRYKVDPRRRFATETEGLLRTFVRHCLSSGELTEEAQADVTHLAQVLGVSATRRDAIYQEEALALFQSVVDQVVADHELTEEEAQQLDRTRESLGLASTAAERAYAQAAHGILQTYLFRAIEDGRYSPAEEAQLYDVARKLGVNLQLDAATQHRLARLRQYWEIESGEPTPNAVDINLQRGEQCYFTTAVNWYEMRTETRSTRYSGPVARVRIAKGVYWRIGEVKAQRITQEVLRLIDSGTVYLTNKRLIFMGGRKNTTLRLNKIMDYEVFSNGVQLQKDAGKSPFLEFSDDVDIFALLLERFLHSA